MIGRAAKSNVDGSIPIGNGLFPTVIKIHGGYNVPKEATMDWMSAVFVAILTVLAAEAMGALLARR